MTKEQFWDDLRPAHDAARKHHTTAQICRFLYLPSRSTYYDWLARKNAPSTLARIAVIRILQGLVP